MPTFLSLIVTIYLSLGLKYSSSAYSISSAASVSRRSCLKMSSSSGSPAVDVSTATSTMITSKQTLYDIPVSNNGARCRMILYKKNIPTSEVSIVAPTEIGGLKSNEYMSINPQAKMPALVCHETGLKLGESDTIARYLLSKYNNENGPSFQPDLSLSNYICRIHDIYMGPIQSCMYKGPPFGQYGTRKDAIQEYIKQLAIIENLIESDTLYLCGNEVSLADATLFPSLIFVQFMLPKFDIEPALPPKLSKYFENVIAKDDTFQKIYNEIMDGLVQWNNRGRWDPILGAGVRDTDPGTIFGTFSFLIGDTRVPYECTYHVVW